MHNLAAEGAGKRPHRAIHGFSALHDSTKGRAHPLATAEMHRCFNGPMLSAPDSVHFESGGSVGVGTNVTTAARYIGNSCRRTKKAIK